MLIEKYSFGSINIEGTIYKKDVIIFPERVYSPWWREKGHSLSINDLNEVISYNPEILIIGTGAYGVMDVPDSSIEFLRDKGIEVRVSNTKDAVNLFNKEIEIGKNVVACLHLTC